MAKVQLNLLPDVKLTFIRAQRYRRLIIALSLFVSIAAVILMVLMLTFNQLQKVHLNNLSNDIINESKTLQEQPQITKILTVQKQLDSLGSLHASKLATPRLFGYLNQVTPAQVDITNLKVDFTAKTATISGTADALSNINKYIDTLKFTTYDSSDGVKGEKAFTNVVLSNFTLSSDAKVNQNRAATYIIVFVYNESIFDIAKKINLSVPSVTTTRSQLEKPDELFSEQVNPVPLPVTPKKKDGN